MCGRWGGGEGGEGGGHVTPGGRAWSYCPFRYLWLVIRIRASRVAAAVSCFRFSRTYITSSKEPLSQRERSGAVPRIRTRDVSVAGPGPCTAPRYAIC